MAVGLGPRPDALTRPRSAQMTPGLHGSSHPSCPAERPGERDQSFALDLVENQTKTITAHTDRRAAGSAPPRDPSSDAPRPEVEESSVPSWRAVAGGALHPCSKGRPKSLDLKEKRKQHRLSVKALSPTGRRGSVAERVALWKNAGDLHESAKH